MTIIRPNSPDCDRALHRQINTIIMAFINAYPQRGHASWMDDWIQAMCQRRTTLVNPNVRRLFNWIQSIPESHHACAYPACGAVHIPCHIPASTLMGLSPWRKGPFQIGDNRIDSEWQSQLKWDRFSPMMTHFNHANVLDIGCGNGYYMLKMLEHTPRWVVGLDPSDLAFMQFCALQRMTNDPRLHYLPIGWSDAPAMHQLIDVTVCFGVLYHQRDPINLLRMIRQCTRKKGRLLLDTLIIDAPDDRVIFPKTRYATMPNVYFIPTISTLTAMLHRTGFQQVDILSITPTDSTEQRTTPWSPGPSLIDGLDPQTPSRTIEGYPAPCRVALSATC